MTKRYSPKRIARLLSEVAQTSIAEVARKRKVSPVTLRKWRDKDNGKTRSRRPQPAKAVGHDELSRLQRVIVDQAAQIQELRDLLR